MTKKFSSFKGHQLITESWRSFINESETGAQDSEMYEGYGTGGVRGSSYSGFPPAQARALAKQLATMSSRKSLSYGDEGKLNDYLGQQKYSTSREAKDDIIKYLVGNGFGYRADYT